MDMHLRSELVFGCCCIIIVVAIYIIVKLIVSACSTLDLTDAHECLYA